MNIKIEGLDKLIKKFEKMPDKVKGEMRVALEASVEDIREYAQSHHRFISRGGQTEKYGIVSSVDGLTGTVRLATDIAVWQHEGTRPHIIDPKLVKPCALWAAATLWADWALSFLKKSAIPVPNPTLTCITPPNMKGRLYKPVLPRSYKNYAGKFDMDYITLADITDRIIECTAQDIGAANAYVEHQAMAAGVALADISNPTPFIVKRLAVCYACYLRALARAGQDPTVTFDGARGQDVYDQKRKMYLEELERISKSLTAKDFAGREGSGGDIVLSLSRA